MTMHGSDKRILDVINRPIKEELEKFETDYKEHLRTDAEYLQPLLEYIGEGKGKRLRPMVFFLSQGLVSRPDPDSISTAILLELLHTATLIHDDVVDGSMERRGRRSLNAVWGDRVSVLLADYLFAKVLAMGVESQWKDVLRIVSRVVMDMGRGELQQTLGDVGNRANIDDYFQLIQSKTAGLFRAAGELGGLAVDADEDEINRLGRLGEAFGMAFQIRDDILDFSGMSDKMGKPVGQDISNGKMTLPLILALDEAEEDDRQMVMDGLYRGDEIDAEWIHAFVERERGVEKAQERARIFARQATSVLETFEPSAYRDSWEKLVAHDLVRAG